MLAARGQGVAAQGTVAQHYQFRAVGLLPEHGRGPAAAVEGACGFPGGFAGGLVDGEDFGPAQAAIGQVMVIIQNQQDEVSKSNG